MPDRSRLSCPTPTPRNQAGGRRNCPGRKLRSLPVMIVIHGEGNEAGQHHESRMSADCGEKTPEDAGRQDGKPPINAEPHVPRRHLLARLADTLVLRCPICRSRHLRNSGPAKSGSVNSDPASTLITGRGASSTCVCTACGIKFQPSLFQTVLMRRAEQPYRGHSNSPEASQEPAWSFRSPMTEQDLPELFYETLGEQHFRGTCRSFRSKEPETTIQPDPIETQGLARNSRTTASAPHLPEARSSASHFDTMESPSGLADAADLTACLQRAISETLSAAAVVAKLRWHSLELRTRPLGSKKHR
jgi:hypothetical protein